MVKIESWQLTSAFIRHDLDKFRSRMTEAEDRISHLEDSTRADSRELHALQLQVKVLQDRAILKIPGLRSLQRHP